MADTNRDRTEAATRRLGYGAISSDSLPAALGVTGSWDRFVEHVKAAKLPGDDGEGEPPVLEVPIMQYGDGPHDYISTIVDAGQVVVQDGNDPTGKAWKFPEKNFVKFVRELRGEDVEDEDKPEGDSMYEGAIKAQKATAEKAAESEQEAQTRRQQAETGPVKATKAAKSTGNSTK